MTLVKSLRFRVLYETEILDKELYNVYECQGVKIYVLNNLKAEEEIHIYQKATLPFTTPKFGVRGIKV